MARYTALIDGRAGAYGAVIPDLPGCTAMGRTIEEVLANAVASVRDWIEVTEQHGETVPPPRSIEQLREDPDVSEALLSGATLASVPFIREAGRPVKANLSIDAGLLAAIDETAKAQGLTRSAFLARVAREKIETEG